MTRLALLILLLGLGGCISASKQIGDAARKVDESAVEISGRASGLVSLAEATDPGDEAQASTLRQTVMREGVVIVAKAEGVRQTVRTGIVDNIPNVKDRTPLLDTLRWLAFPMLGLFALALLGYLGVLPLAMAVARTGVSWAVRGAMRLAEMMRPKTAAVARLLSEGVEKGDINTLREGVSVLRSISPVIDAGFRERRDARTRTST